MTTRKTMSLGLILVIVLGLATLLLNRYKTSSTMSPSEDGSASKEAAPAASAVPATTKAAPVVTLEGTSSETQEQVRILEEILVQHNDNDPRMDKELRSEEHTSELQSH